MKKELEEIMRTEVIGDIIEDLIEYVIKSTDDFKKKIKKDKIEELKKAGKWVSKK
jgi:hypothetical protein